MVDGEYRARFMAVLKWLAKRFPVNGVARTLPSGEDLADYFAALRDVPIEDLEGGARWHYGHSEFFPDRPAALRRSSEEWRKAHPRLHQPPQAMVQKWEEISDESRETGMRELQRVLDMLANGEASKLYEVHDLVGKV